VTQRIVIADGDADTAQVAAFERDRRALLRRGLGLGGALVAASSIPLLAAVRDAFAADDTDTTLLQKAITLERTMVLAYDQIIRDALLAAPEQRLARVLRSHEQQHADTLTTALTDLGGAPPVEPVGVEAIDKLVKGVDDLRRQPEILGFLIELETAAVAAYYDAQAKFVEAKLLQSGASIMAAEGQHLVVLRQAARLPAVPEAIETGKK
jgi:bacterioferritin (cytochrome b1)